ncbi:hypothetical protein [Nocardiopsis rhodophaea]|uniref:hypothetical protein n=1 Tax=Nocardiopsis rhodophaea TaxID=280238 RepID=UPI0031D26C26
MAFHLTPGERRTMLDLFDAGHKVAYIAQHTQRARNTVLRVLHEAGRDTSRGRGAPSAPRRPEITTDACVRLYIDQDRSLTETARALGCSPYTVRRRLVAAKVPIRRVAPRVQGAPHLDAEPQERTAVEPSARPQPP